VGDPSKLRGLGWSPKYELDTSLRDGLLNLTANL